MVQASRRKYHYIYKITRIKDGRYYIGMHSTDNEEDGYFGSGKLITRSIRKHGKEAHIKEILEFLDNRELLKKREAELVNEECLNDPLCMNLVLGGSGGSSVGKLGGLASAKSAKWTVEKRKECVKKSHETFANHKKEDPEFAALIFAEKSKKSKSNNERRKANSEKIWSEKAIIAAQSPEAVAKRTNTQKEIDHQQGEKNSQYGTCWITDGINNKKIKKTDLAFYLLNGWKTDRICVFKINEEKLQQYIQWLNIFLEVDKNFVRFVEITGYQYSKRNLLGCLKRSKLLP